MTNQLSLKELGDLISSVFSPNQNDKALGILIDMPDVRHPDHAHWRARRELAHKWTIDLRQLKARLNLERVDAIYYQNVGNNNADLPQTAYFFVHSAPQSMQSLFTEGIPLPFVNIFQEFDMFLAPTEFSATAPMKLNAASHNFRAATMPGFSEAMIPALRLDYAEINRRVSLLKSLLDRADAVEIQFRTDNDQSFKVQFDLRFRTAHASGGRFPEPGSAGNLPSGECYIVPYEGEKSATSESRGILPVQFGDEIVLYKIEQNKAVEILSQGAHSGVEAEKIHDEPAYANIAEIGFGVLKDFGIKPINELLLDEKLGLHIAFGRSDHFGGAVGAKNFSAPEKVVHIDRIFIPDTQPSIRVEWVKLMYQNQHETLLMQDGEYTIF
ncbi:hypothetical protein JXJ21_03695 [candidate division KSB1 bacterium]|nr:hypothetical protein [candidate division KSB1 bacterium]